jgi:CheY-like chemotaxis protein
MSGLVAASRMREHRQLDATRLVALSGYGSDSDRAAATANGLDAYLIKPVTLEQLSETIARLTA